MPRFACLDRYEDINDTPNEWSAPSIGFEGPGGEAGVQIAFNNLTFFDDPRYNAAANATSSASSPHVSRGVSVVVQAEYHSPNWRHIADSTAPLIHLAPTEGNISRLYRYSMPNTLIGSKFS
eukprot:SAG31_NODE_21815_length_540_cov_0.875283_2_plen_121_part_01